MFWTLALSAAITLLALSPVVLPEGTRLEHLPAPLSGIEKVGRIVTSEVAAPVIGRIADADDEEAAGREASSGESAAESQAGDVAGALVEGSEPEPARASGSAPNERRDPAPGGGAPPPVAERDDGKDKPKKEKPGKGKGGREDEGLKAGKWKGNEDDDADDHDDRDDDDWSKWTKGKSGGDQSWGKVSGGNGGGDRESKGASRNADSASKASKGKGGGDHSKSRSGSRD